MSCFPALLGFPLRFLLRGLGGGLHRGFRFGQSAGGLLVGLDVTGQMLPEFGIEFLGRAGVGEWSGESRILVGLSMGDDIDAERLVIHLGHRNEHSAAGKKRHEFDEHIVSFLESDGSFGTSEACVQGELPRYQGVAKIKCVYALYQRLKELDWDTFQRFSFQLLSEKHPGLAIRHVEGVGGDRGIDYFLGRLNGRPTIWQPKQFPNGLGPRQRPQVTGSLRAVLKSFTPVQWVLVISIDLDLKAHQWFQKLQKSYEQKTCIGLFQASDFVRELVHRRNLREAFFPGATFDAVTLRQALRGVNALNSFDLDGLTRERMDDLVARLEAEDARFSYQIVYAPDVGEDIAKAAPNHPLLVASVLDESKRVDIFARDLQAIRLDPPKVQFGVTPSGLKKINEFLKTGKPQELEGNEWSHAKSTFDFLLSKSEMDGWKMTLLPDPNISKRFLPMRLTFANGDKAVRYEFVQFRVLRAGTEEVEIVSETPLPFVLSLVLSSGPAKECGYALEQRFEGADVREVAKAVQAFGLLHSGGRLELFALDVQKVLGTLSSVTVKTESRQGFARVILDAAAVSEKYSVKLRIPKRIKTDDMFAIAILNAIADGAPLPVGSFGGKLIKTREHEANFKPDMLQQTLEIVLNNERLDPRPIVFGVPVDTGPVSLVGKSARIKQISAFLKKYARAKYGDAIPIAFTVSELRAQPTSIREPGLHVKQSTSQ